MKPGERGKIVERLIMSGWNVSIADAHESPSYRVMEASRLSAAGAEYRIRVTGPVDMAVKDLERLCRAAIP